MTENTEVLIVIVLVLVTNLITYGMTWHYWSTKLNAVLRDQALEHAGRDQELINARIVTGTFGKMRATALANLEEEE